MSLQLAGPSPPRPGSGAPGRPRSPSLLNCPSTAPLVNVVVIFWHPPSGLGRRGRSTVSGLQTLPDHVAEGHPLGTADHVGWVGAQAARHPWAPLALCSEVRKPSGGGQVLLKDT